MDSKTEQPGATLNEENKFTTQKILTESKETEAIDNSKRKQKRVQAKTGEVLTAPEVLEWLENEHNDREKKKMKPSSSKHDTPPRGNMK